MFLAKSHQTCSQVMQLVKLGSRKITYFLTLKNSVRSASPLPYSMVSQGGSGHPHSHTFVHAHTNTFLVSYSASFSHREVSLSPLRARSGLEGGWGCPSSMWLRWLKWNKSREAGERNWKPPSMPSTFLPPADSQVMSSSSPCSGPCLTETGVCTNMDDSYGI